MISEKTVELNLTTELLNWMWKVHRITFCSIAPSQQEEAKLGFDTAIVGKGHAYLIQYKRAYVKGNVWTYHLNRNTNKDQHLKLQQLATLGFPVYYAFPFFHTPTQVMMLRRQLLMYTFWVPPLLINPIGGPTGHHDAIFDSSTNRWTVKSEETEFERPMNFDIFASTLAPNLTQNNIKEMMEAYNKIFASDMNIEKPETIDYKVFESNVLISCSLP